MYENDHLLDWQQRWSELEADQNPFVCVVMAQLAAKGERDPHRRKDAKLQLTRLLLERGYSKDETRALIRIMDWIINLPEGLDAEYVAEVRQLAEEYKMPFVTSFERVGEKRGEKRGEK
ncbi:hypothetical protein LRD17_08550, partial [Halorhodospira halochloris]|nr:hypothetical protein [Halorhodospira halochloris]